MEELSTNIVIFGYNAKKGVSVLLKKRKYFPYIGKWAIPGKILEKGEPMEDSVKKGLKEEAGISANYIEQLHSFEAIEKYPDKRTISITYYGLVDSEKGIKHHNSVEEDVNWFNIDELPSLAFNHDEIIAKAIETLRHKILYDPIGFELLGKKFRFSELHQLHETLLNKKMDRRNFKKKVLQMDILEELNEKSTGKGRPGNLFRFDKEKFFNRKKKRLVFDI